MSHPLQLVSFLVFLLHSIASQELKSSINFYYNQFSFGSWFFLVLPLLLVHSSNHSPSLVSQLKCDI